MIKYILKRLWHSGILAIVMSLIVFFGLYVVGDPVEMLSDDEFTEQDKIELAIELGLDKPLYEQYFTYTGGMLQGDFGTSFVYNRPVLDLIMERLPATLEISLLAMVIGLGIGIPLGIFSGIKNNSRASKNNKLFHNRRLLNAQFLASHNFDYGVCGFFAMASGLR